MTTEIQAVQKRLLLLAISLEIARYRTVVIDGVYKATGIEKGGVNDDRIARAFVFDMLNNLEELYLAQAAAILGRRGRGKAKRRTKAQCRKASDARWNR